MKKLFLLLAIAAASCTTDSYEDEAPLTIAKRVYEKRTTMSDYDTGAFISDSGYNVISTIFYSNLASDCGKVLQNDNSFETRTTTTGQRISIGTYERVKIVCN